MPGECRKCGGCCNPVIIAENIEGVEVANAPPGWIEKHWQSAGERDGYFGYWCDLHDLDTHLCKDYENRPGICRDYPFYGNGIPEGYIGDDCGYAIGKQIEEGSNKIGAANMP